MCIAGRHKASLARMKEQYQSQVDKEVDVYTYTKCFQKEEVIITLGMVPIKFYQNTLQELNLLK